MNFFDTRGFGRMNETMPRPRPDHGDWGQDQGARAHPGQHGFGLMSEEQQQHVGGGAGGGVQSRPAGQGGGGTHQGGGVSKAGSGTHQGGGIGQRGGSGLTQEQSLPSGAAPYAVAPQGWVAAGGPPPLPPPLFDVGSDCLILSGLYAPKWSEADWMGNRKYHNDAGVDLVQRIQHGLVYLHMGGYKGVPLKPTGMFDAATMGLWAVFVQTHSTADEYGRLHAVANPSVIDCRGLELLAQAVNEKWLANMVGTPIDLDVVGGFAEVGGATQNIPGQGTLFVKPTIAYVKRGGLWIVAPESRPSLQGVLSSMLVQDAADGSASFLRKAATFTSAPVPSGLSAWALVQKMLAQGYAAMIAPRSLKSASDAIQLAFTMDAAVVYRKTSTNGSAVEGSMQGFGAPAFSTKVGGGASAASAFASKSGIQKGPDPQTGLAPWALITASPAALLAEARAFAGHNHEPGTPAGGGTTTGQLPGAGSGGGGGGAGGGTTTGQLPQDGGWAGGGTTTGQLPGGGGGGGGGPYTGGPLPYDPYVPDAGAAAPTAAEPPSAVPSWALPVAGAVIVGGLAWVLLK